MRALVHLQEHLFLVCELLRANLYEFQKYNRESGDAPYFTNARIQRIARQVRAALRAGGHVNTSSWVSRLLHEHHGHG